MENPTHISKTIKNRARQIAGKKIKCRSCGCPDAWIESGGFRFYVRCPDCSAFYLLKEQNAFKSLESEAISQNTTIPD